jgi:hypothetical protein
MTKLCFILAEAAFLFVVTHNIAQTPKRALIKNPFGIFQYNLTFSLSILLKLRYENWGSEGQKVIKAFFQGLMD